MLMLSVFVQNIVDMIVDHALWVAVLKKALAKNDNTSAIADHVKATGHNIKWDHFDILAKGKTDYHCKIKETFFIQEL